MSPSPTDAGPAITSEHNAASVLAEFMTVDADGDIAFHDVAELGHQMNDLHADEWAHIVTAFDANPDAFHVAYEYIRCHPIFWYPNVIGHPAGNSAGTSAADVAFDDLPDPHAVDWTVQDGDGWAHVYVMVVRVDPATGSISDNPAANTKTEVWFETGPWLWPRELDASVRGQYPAGGMASHDYDLDCGADTFEGATVALAHAVRARYGDDRYLVSAPRTVPSIDTATR